MVLAMSLHAQTNPQWRHVGTATLDLGLADLATGPVQRVLYTSDGARMAALLADGRVMETRDFSTWQTLMDGSGYVQPLVIQPPAVPEEGAQYRVAPGDPQRVYAFGRFVYRSEDSGKHWQSLTNFKGVSIVGEGVRDAAVSPRSPDEIAVATGAGVFRSLDGGRSWHGLNDQLPNLPGARVRSAPADGHGAQIEFANGRVFEWLPGEKRTWRVIPSTVATLESGLRLYLTQQFGVEVTAVATAGTFQYAGDVNGGLHVSADSGSTWVHAPDPRRGRVNAFWVNADDPRNAIAVLSPREGALVLEPQTVLHTINGGSGGWDTVSRGLPNIAINGVTADLSADTVYVATPAGVQMGRFSLRTFGAAPQWSQVAGLPSASVTDVRLDDGETQLWATVEGLGLYATQAPHRALSPKVVSAADWMERAAAPGALLSVMGANVSQATAGGANVPVLAPGEARTEVQIPMNATGTTFSLAVNGPQGAKEFPAIALRATAPAIFEIDGDPQLEDVDRNEMLDIQHPAHSHMRVRIYASGLGKVRPDWDAGVPGPVDNSPQVVASVIVYLNHEQVEVSRAILAPGLTGVYWIEIELPALLESGMADLYLRVGGQDSNHVRVYAESDL
jgi:uncharacterized protein (TIGR03437 family)